jgi:hypothetical protein
VHFRCDPSRAPPLFGPVSLLTAFRLCENEEEQISQYNHTVKAYNKYTHILLLHPLHPPSVAMRAPLLSALLLAAAAVCGVRGDMEALARHLASGKSAAESLVSLIYNRYEVSTTSLHFAV